MWDKQKALDLVYKTGLIPIIRVDSADIALKVADAFLDGGINIIEVTFSVPDAIKVVEPADGQSMEMSNGLESQKIHANLATKAILEQWAGFTDQSVSDSELLQYLGFSGQDIPNWYQKSVAQWMIKDERVSMQELMDALEFFNKKGLLI